MMAADPDLAYLAKQMTLFARAIDMRAHLTAGADERATAAAAAVAEARRDIAAHAESHGDLVACVGLDRLKLTQSEACVVWLLATLALDPETREQLGSITGEPLGDPTLAAIRRLIYGDAPSRIALDELSPRGRLRRLEIIERTSDAPEHRCGWILASRMLELLHGSSGIDRDLAGLVSIRTRDVDASQLAVAPADVDAAIEALRSGAHVLVVASAGAGRRSLLELAAAAVGRTVASLDARRLSADRSECARQLRGFARECCLLDHIPLVANLEALGDRVELVESELVAQVEGCVLATSGSRRPTVRWSHPIITIEMRPVSSEQLGNLWLRELGRGSDDDAEHLASMYPLAPALIHHAAAVARARATGREMLPADIHAAMRCVLDDRLGEYAKRVTVTQSWEDLVLSAEHHGAISELIARVRKRRCVYETWGFADKLGKGLGVSALFSGPPGTGKTMVAALIARDLELELYQVDLGKVVSKWIGETEKNLAAVFDAAEAGRAILLFDEADALFGKRTQVTSSNDRHANLETNYLLQRLESFTGVCLLTSNHESNIDPAFQRRLSLHLRFQLPDVDEREHLWRAMLPKSAPVAPRIDFDGLARRYAMSGGHIRNATVRAAFIAADEGSEITDAHLECAARLEYEGMGKLAIV